MDGDVEKPVIDMARGELIIPRRKRLIRRAVLITVTIVVLLISIPVMWICITIYHMHRMAVSIRNAELAMQQPENFKPAEHYLARLMQSDPKLWKSDLIENPPDWLPPEIGKLEPHHFMPNKGEFIVGCGGGFIDFFGYILDKDETVSNATTSAFELSYRSDKDRVLDRFTLPTNDVITEDELVTSALAELTRRQAAFTSGAQLNLYADNPLDDRKRLIAQHPSAAVRLGLMPAATSKTANGGN